MALEYTRVTEEDGEIGRIIHRDFLDDIRTGFVRVGPERIFLGDNYLKYETEIRNMEVREDDVWIMSHPKTGTTWLQEMVWCIANDLDFQGAERSLQERCPFFEHSALFNFENVQPHIVLPDYMKESIQYVNNTKSPRYIKSHLPWTLMPRQIQDGTRQPKIIYICRNPKDTCISYFHHCQLLEGYDGNFEDFCKLFVGDSVPYAPFWSHVLGFWNRRHQPNILFLKYEDMKRDLASVIRTTSEFLDKNYTDDQVRSLINHLSFDNMKDNNSVNYEPIVDICHDLGLVKTEGKFMRSGTVAEGKGKMSSEMLQKFDAWTTEYLKETDFSF